MDVMDPLLYQLGRVPLYAKLGRPRI